MVIGDGNDDNYYDDSESYDNENDYDDDER